jgi:hypothetical protein
MRGRGLMRTLFWLYVVMIAAGLVFAMVVGVLRV